MTESCRRVFLNRRLLGRMSWFFAEKSPANENAPMKAGHFGPDSMIPETIRRQCGKLSVTVAAVAEKGLCGSRPAHCVQDREELTARASESLRDQGSRLPMSDFRRRVFVERRVCRGGLSGRWPGRVRSVLVPARAGLFHWACNLFAGRVSWQSDTYQSIVDRGRRCGIIAGAWQFADARRSSP